MARRVSDQLKRQDRAVVLERYVGNLELKSAIRGKPAAFERTEGARTMKTRERWHGWVVVLETNVGGEFLALHDTSHVRGTGFFGTRAQARDFLRRCRELDMNGRVSRAVVTMWTES